MKYIVGEERLYNKIFNRNDVVHWDVLSIKKEQLLFFKIISTNSQYLQGVRLAIDVGDGYIQINNVKSKEIRLWEDTCPEKVNIKCVSSEGKISVYNIYGIGNAERQNVRTLMDSCGMLVTKKDNIYRYSCNDVGFQSDFDKLVFEIELL